MSWNTFGRVLRFTTWGESHGPALGAVVDGCPPGLALDEAAIQPFLDARRPGTSKFTTQRKEPDQVRILSGTFEGRTTGTPISLMIENVDQRSKDYSDVAKAYRPGHADYAYDAKYGFRDYRGGGRSSARETAARVAAGAVARLVIPEVTITAYVSEIGGDAINRQAFDAGGIGRNPFFCAEPARVPELEATIDALRREGDSIGARVNVVAQGVPVGLGEPIFDRLDADIAHAMMGINAVKGVEIGAGFASVAQRGSEHRDELTPDGFLTNHAGGTLGGIASGQDLLVSIAIKPTSSIVKPGRTINVAGEPVEVATTGRHDPCVGIRAVPIAEAMLALVLMDHLLRHRAQNGDVRRTTPVIA